MLNVSSNFAKINKGKKNIPFFNISKRINLLKKKKLLITKKNNTISNNYFNVFNSLFVKVSRYKFLKFQKLTKPEAVKKLNVSVDKKHQFLILKNIRLKNNRKEVMKYKLYNWFKKDIQQVSKNVFFNRIIKAYLLRKEPKASFKLGKNSFLATSKDTKKISLLKNLTNAFLKLNQKGNDLNQELIEKKLQQLLFYYPFRFFVKNRETKQRLFLNYYLSNMLGNNITALIVEPYSQFYNTPTKKFINMYVKRNLTRSKNLYFAKRVSYYQNMYYLINFFVKFTALGVSNLFLEHMATQLRRDSRHWLFLKLLKHLFQVTFANDSLNFNRMRFVLKGKFRGPARTSKRLIRFKDNREIPLQTFTSKVDYSYYPADTKYGTISIKLWIFYKKEILTNSQLVLI